MTNLAKSTSGIDGKPKSTRQRLTKIPGVSCLYRHPNGGYYAVKKHLGKIKTLALKTEAGFPVTDRKIAERCLREWLEGFEDGQVPVETSITLRDLLVKFATTKRGDSLSLQANVSWMAKHFGFIPEKQKPNRRGENRRRSDVCAWKRGLDVRVADIRTSDLSAFMAEKSYMKPGAYNTLSAYIKQLFDLAVADRILKRSPFQDVVNKRKKVRKERRPTPSADQFAQIVAFIRNRRFTDHAKDSADLTEFLGLAGLGQAEAGQLCWGDLDMTKKHFSVKRCKTQTWFEVPYYPKLRKFLEDLYERQERPTPETKVFRVKSIKRSLEAACQELNYTHYSPRALRRQAIVTMLRAGVGSKSISKWQGHQDGGRLILNTYTEVLSEADQEFEDRELAKLV